MGSSGADEFSSADLQARVDAAPEGEPEVIPVDYFTGLLNSRSI
jgi:hypothetical protein